MSLLVEYRWCLAEVHSLFNVVSRKCPGDVAAIQEVVANLRVIGDQLEQDVVARAAQNLSRTLQNSHINVSVSNIKPLISSRISIILDDKCHVVMFCVQV